ncbi:hypothetical protein AYL99_01548 [Fonsecaea erecta]|uniref:FHA domain-containing protein n=1 Tax=Fonsecaea erecta TaxID=1367422 RepID=A0A179A229_9EURO|nr:hypothetical protein AYL99_01548 [Fonsecaea erecta]OAP65576.1 hypothetical protein AYL99_01548 [Fonsecaea erecta]
MTDHSPPKSLTITLRELDSREPIPKRVITLEGPDWELRIGRGTESRIEELTPAENNAWFASRVLSRRHAILHANPTTKEIFIHDVGSLHGTFLSGSRLHTNEPGPLWPDDIVTLGANVIRGSSHFSALRLRVTWNWGIGTLSQPNVNHTNAGVSRNTFSADYSDEEAYGSASAQASSRPQEDKYEPREGSNEYHSELDDKAQNLRVPVCDTSVAMDILEVRTFTVPDSDDASNTPGHASSADVSDEDSPTSSPLMPRDLQEVKSVAPETLRREFINDVLRVTDPDRTDPTQVIVPSSAQQAEPLPAVDESISEDSYGDGELERETSWLFTPPTSLGRDLAGPTSSSSGTDLFGPARSPSPSDTAMVNPLIGPDFRIKWTAPPFLTPESPHQQTVTLDKVGPLDRSISAWAGHNSVLYEPVVPPLVPEKSALVPYPPSASSLAFYSDAFTFNPSPLLPPPRPRSPLSIASASPQQLAVNDSDGAKKRKADQISSDQSLDPIAAPSGPHSPENGDILATTATRKVESVGDVTADRLLNPSTSASEVAESTSAEETEMPVRKKAKKNNDKAPSQRSSGSNSLVTTAGVAVAGVAIGAVGMFLGLLALPEEYLI